MPGPLIAAAAALILILLVLLASTRLLVNRVEARFPPAGAFAGIGGVSVHYIDVPAGPSADLAPMVFIHGASGNARDLHGAFAPSLEGRARMVFVDRPGAGYSGRAGARHAAPAAQADTIAALMDGLGIGQAVIVGHSLGGAVAAAFALGHPERTTGLVLISPASHPWPGAGISWYYRLANRPVLGWLFAHLLAVPFGNLKYRAAVREVFAPDRAPGDYSKRSGTRLVLRPASFLANAGDLGELHGHVSRMAPRYGEIAAPTTIVTGDRDAIVAAELHSVGLSRDIPGARLVWLENAGHMPTYSHTRAIIAEIEAVNRCIGRGCQMPERPSLET